MMTKKKILEEGLLEQYLLGDLDRTTQGKIDADDDDSDSAEFGPDID